MLYDAPDTIAVFTEAGRDDTAAEVGYTNGTVTICAARAALTTLVLRWDVRLGERLLVLGDHWERGYGDLEWRGIVAERPLPWYALIHDTATGATHGIGVKTGAASLASWRVDEGGVMLVLDLRSGGVGVRLGQRTLTAATVVYRAPVTGESPFVAATQLCNALCDAPRLPRQPVYGGNDWYFRYGNIGEETVKTDAALIRTLAPSNENAPHFVIDAGWFPGKGCNGGPYHTGNERFPDLPGLARWMEGEGVRPGIWMRPLLTSAPFPEAWRLRESPYLDPTVPEVLELVRADVTRLTGTWGYRLLKHDFTTFDLTDRWGFQMGGECTPSGWAFADRSKTTAEVIRALYVAIREAAGEALLIGCNTVGHLGAGLFELQRTGDDTSGRHWERTRKMGVNTLAFRMPQHGTFFAADADCVGLTSAIPWALNRQWLDLLARSGTPLFVSADPSAVGPEQCAALTDAFARAAVLQEPAEPLDWLDTTCPRHWRFGEERVTYDWNGGDALGSAFSCPG